MKRRTYTQTYTLIWQWVRVCLYAISWCIWLYLLYDDHNVTTDIESQIERDNDDVTKCFGYLNFSSMSHHNWSMYYRERKRQTKCTHHIFYGSWWILLPVFSRLRLTCIHKFVCLYRNIWHHFHRVTLRKLDNVMYIFCLFQNLYPNIISSTWYTFWWCDYRYCYLVEMIESEIGIESSCWKILDIEILTLR